MVEEKKYAVDFAEWNNSPILKAIDVFGGFDKDKKEKVSATPIKIVYMKVVESKLYKEKDGSPKKSGYALAEKADGTKVRVYLPMEIYNDYTAHMQEYKGSLLLLEKKFNVSYSIRRIWRKGEKIWEKKEVFWIVCFSLIFFLN